MRKTFFALLSALLSLTLSAQGHLEFMGVPIDGTVGGFVSRLRAKGVDFDLVRQDASEAVLMWSFGGYAMCKVTVYASEGTVYQVGVMLPENSEWSGLKAQYASLKEALTKKYGAPAGGAETFEEPYRDGDGRELEALENDKVFYAARFDMDGGFVLLSVNALPDCVGLTYMDEMNSEKIAGD